MNDTELIAMLRGQLFTQARIEESLGAFNLVLWDKLAAKERTIERQRSKIVELQKQLRERQ